ncbi:hypothetical protein CALVIDRAFT_538911 [Calocera viscosa TUFC12733]|uniref:Uncharacterized protein n=1 Tax=Calocera viscosa (strain TUFC12733) TaxID=1330018 RepID=A0A167KAY7_CALVF|nr:hypothetical protein CALVIDRAFT_538911 [Calocera viscosa TUFC12733]
MGGELDEVLLLFFLSNGAHITHIHFRRLIAEAFFNRLPNDALPVMRHASIHHEFSDDVSWATAQWYSDLPSSVHHLHMHIPFWKQDAFRDLSKHLHNKVCRSSGIPFRYIHFEDWSWSDAWEKWPADAGFVVRSAQRLWESKGILLLDNAGRSLRWTLEELEESAL